jgi:hypothetical protein
MSSIKRHMEDIEARRQEGLDLCIEAGSIQECTNHPGTYFEGEEPVETAYRLAVRKIKTGEISGKQRDITDSVKAAFDDNRTSGRCEEC